MTFLLDHGNELLSGKELAAALKRTPQYVSAMKRDGFLMPGNRATLNQALIWLHENPAFTQKRKKFNQNNLGQNNFSQPAPLIILS